MIDLVTLKADIEAEALVELVYVPNTATSIKACRRALDMVWSWDQRSTRTMWAPDARVEGENDCPCHGNCNG
jgi:hypothetical protein